MQVESIDRSRKIIKRKIRSQINNKMRNPFSKAIDHTSEEGRSTKLEKKMQSKNKQTGARKSKTLNFVSHFCSKTWFEYYPPHSYQFEKP